MKSTKDKVIAIDGPAGSGKSSVTGKVAEILNLTHINTGALFRSLVVFIKSTLSLEAFYNLSEIEQTNFLDSLKAVYSHPPLEIRVNDKKFSAQQLYGSEISNETSILSSFRTVREFIEKWEKQIVAETQNICIIEGRDIGTAVFPNALLKFYLTASTEERAQRRKKEHLYQNISLAILEQQIRERDHRDMNREFSPLKKAEDAILVDSSGLTENEVIDIFIDEIYPKLKGHK
jgi:cytidylate kinase